MLKKLKVKKFVKICSYIILILGFILLFTELALRYLLPLPSVKTKILNQISSAIGAKLNAENISAGFFGVEIDNVTLDTDKENLIVVKNIKIMQNPFKVLKGQLSVNHIYINEPVLQIIRYKDGSFNFDPLLSSSQTDPKAEKKEKTSSGVPLDLRINSFHLNNAEIIYTDLMEDIKADIKDFNLSIHNFSFYKPFGVNLSFHPYFEQKGFIIDDIKIALSGDINLNEFNLKEATLDLKQFLISYKKALFKAKTKINNFEDPSVVFDMELENFSSETLSSFGKDMPQFDIPLITAKGNLDYLTQKERLNINNLTLISDDTKIDFKGNLNFAKTFSVKGKITLNTILESLSELYLPMKEYEPKGQISADFDFSWPLALSGKCNLTDIGFFIKKAGTFEKLNTFVEINSLDDIKIENLSGNINKNPFQAKANYLKKKNYADVFLDFKADKLYLIDTSEKEDTTTEQSKEEPQTTSENTQDTKEEASFVPININAKVDIAKIDVPYLRGNKLVFNAKAKNITSKMDQTHGTFELNIQDGQIKDVYTISNANAITKVMFMSLGIISRVINTLNVLDLLSGIGKVIVGNKQDNDEEDEIIKHQEINGKMDFDSFQTLVDFNEGLATMKKCSFVSDLFSFRVNGNINFDSRDIKLNVDSSPGKHTEDGIMPLNIDIKGTIEEPKGSLSVLSSVSALVSDTITNNPVSNMLKNTWSKIFSSKEEEIPAEKEEPQEELTETKSAE